MHTTTIRARRSGILVATLMTLMSGIAATPVAAASPPAPGPTTSGHVGVHHLVDTLTSPGARCHYPTTPNYIDQVKVKAPVARARANKPSQRIGFRVVIQGFDGSAWHDILVSSFQKRTATPTSDAPFTDRVIDIRHSDTDASQRYRARVDLRWYSASGATLGKASMPVIDYLIRWEGTSDSTVTDWCGDTTG